jgi:hypothetical protein
LFSDECLLLRGRSASLRRHYCTDNLLEEFSDLVGVNLTRHFLGQ